jgi:2-C-methyl-D-erythritol 4-phosphate cytidylyltransferase
MKTTPEPGKMVWGILLAGGESTRYGGSSKLLEPIGDHPVLVHSIQAVASCVSHLVLVYHPYWESAYRHVLQQMGPLSCLTTWTCGGSTRRESVLNGLKQVPSHVEVVLIHDAARPLVSYERIQAVLEPVLNQAALGASLGRPMTDTLKQVVGTETPWVTCTLPRDRLWQTHTPQVFQQMALKEAHRQIPLTVPATDDAMLLELAFPESLTVQMVLDEASNIKITTPDDLAMARRLWIGRVS